MSKHEKSTDAGTVEKRALTITGRKMWVEVKYKQPKEKTSIPHKESYYEKHEVLWDMLIL